MVDFDRVKSLVEGFLNAEGTADGLQTEFEDDNYCALTDDDGHIIHLSFDPAESSLTLLGALGKLPEEEVGDELKCDEETSIEVLKFFLGCNLLWDKAAGSSFAYVADGDYLVMQRKLNLDGLTQDDFNAALLDFAADLPVWIGRYAEVVTSALMGESLQEMEID
ncbi:MAG: type III secretion system chaperone [Succinivibrio sp.]|nr:type III secretion system chaperone [Succinivibrio sp.]